MGMGVGRRGGKRCRCGHNVTNCIKACVIERLHGRFVLSHWSVLRCNTKVTQRSYKDYTRVNKGQYGHQQRSHRG